MTDKETKSNAPSAAGSSVVMVDKSSSNRHKPFRRPDLQDDGPVELHHKRSRAPAVPSVTEESKKSPKNAAVKEQKESQRAMTPDKAKHVSSKVSSKRASSPEAISMATIEMDVQRADNVPSVTQPIPATVDPASDITGTKDLIEQDDSITEEITELRTAESPHREWSDEEAGGLPRSDSRASRTSRVSRVVRQLFCCGVRYNRPSEHDVSSPRGGEFPGGI